MHVCLVAYLIFYHLLLMMLAWSYWQAIFTPVVTSPSQVAQIIIQLLADSSKLL